MAHPLVALGTGGRVPKKKGYDLILVLKKGYLTPLSHNRIDLLMHFLHCAMSTCYALHNYEEVNSIHYMICPVDEVLECL